MGADMISVGYTVSPRTITDEEANAILDKYMDKVMESQDDWDYQGYFVEIVELDEDAPQEEQDAEMRGMVRDTLATGLGFVLGGEDNRLVTGYRIGDTGNVFYTAGAPTWGDAPFEEFDAVVLTVDACRAVPELGDALGILGGGIVLA